MNLSYIQKKELVTVISVKGDYSAKLFALGVKPKAKLEVIRHGNGIMQVRVGGTDIIIRHSIAEQIEVDWE